MNTVNVIEMVDNNIIKLKSFSDNVLGNKEADELFFKIAIQNGCKRSEVISFIEDGYYENNNYKLYLTHSTN